MAAIRQTYWNAIDKNYGLQDHYHPLWEPNLPAALGDYGRMDNGSWSRQGPPSDWGFDPAQPVIGKPGSGSFADGQGIKIEAALKGSTDSIFKFIGEAKAGVRVAFAESECTVVIAPERTTAEIDSVRGCARAMILAWHKNDLSYGDVVLVGMTTAPSAILVVSEADESEIDFTFDGDITAGTHGVLDLSSDLKWARDVSDVWHQIYPQGATLAVRGLRLREESVSWNETRPVVDPAEAALPEETVMRFDEVL